jgi:putative transcriptional regulator
MAIIVRLDVMLARRKMRSKELAERIGITEANVSLLKSGRVKGVRFETLEKICEVLECQPGDILEYGPDETAARQEVSRWARPTNEASGSDHLPG